MTVPTRRPQLVRPANPVPLVVRWGRPARETLAALARLAAAGGLIVVPDDPWFASYRCTGSVAGDVIALRVTPTARPDPRLGMRSLPLVIEGRIRDVDGGVSQLDGHLRAEVSATWWLPLVLAAAMLPVLAVAAGAIVAVVGAAALAVSVPIAARALSARQPADLAAADLIQRALASI
jgi:hypothetical protein